MPENKIVRTGHVLSGEYMNEAGNKHVKLAIEVDGEIVHVRCHPATAGKFHCGRNFTVTIQAE